MTDAVHPRILGSLGSADGTGVVRIEDRYDTDIDDLWEALTDPTRLARWYGEVEGDLRPGGQFRTYIAASDIGAMGRVEACEPPRRLRLTSKETDESFRRGQGVPPSRSGACRWTRSPSTVRAGRCTPRTSPATLPGKTRPTPKYAGAGSSLTTGTLRQTWTSADATSATNLGSLGCLPQRDA